jgi:flagellin-like protein
MKKNYFTGNCESFGIIPLARNRRGLSPIIVTVILIALTIGITSVLFLWFRGMVEEGVTKFSPPKNIKLVCGDVEFEASYSSGTLNIVNTGNVPIFRITLRMFQGGNYQTRDITEFSAGKNWPSSGLGQGGTFSGDIGSEIGSSEKITVLPVLIGASSKGKKTFECGEQYGRELEI